MMQLLGCSLIVSRFRNAFPFDMAARHPKTTYVQSTFFLCSFSKFQETCPVGSLPVVLFASSLLPRPRCSMRHPQSISRTSQTYPSPSCHCPLPTKSFRRVPPAAEKSENWDQPGRQNVDMIDFQGHVTSNGGTWEATGVSSYAVLTAGKRPSTNT